MPAPMSALGRIVFPYTNGGITHQAHVYVRNPQLVGGVYQIDTRTTGSNDLVWTDAVTALFAALGTQISNDATIGSAILQLRTGTQWNPVASTTPTGTTLAGTAINAQQFTATFRDALFYEVKIQVMEGKTAPPYHCRGYAGLSTVPQYLIKEFTENKTLTNAPYDWVVGRSNQFLRPGGFIACTVTYNRKLRRRRGLA